jgi:predicted ATP-grasp superfamily ATP-dependent carboligase
LDKIGLIDNINNAAYLIEAGRKGFATRGKEAEGRLSYEDGIAEAMSAFQEAHISADAETLILAEYTFLIQELQFCDETDTDSLSSLTQAIQSFDDAFLALKIVEDNVLYQGAEQTYPHHKKYRVKDLPKDAFHLACISHKTRIQNTLRAPGIDPIEKLMLKQRFLNLGAAQDRYAEQQKIVLEK